MGGFETWARWLRVLPDALFQRANWLLYGRTLVSGRKSDSDFIYCLACVLVGPCLTHLETEGFSLFVAFE